MCYIINLLTKICRIEPSFKWYIVMHYIFVFVTVYVNSNTNFPNDLINCKLCVAHGEYDFLAHNIVHLYQYYQHH